MAADIDSGGAVASFSFPLQAGEKAMITHKRTASETIDWTVKAVGGDNDVPVFDSSGNALSITADRSVLFVGPGIFTATVTGGTCDFEGNRWADGHV